MTSARWVWVVFTLLLSLGCRRHPSTDNCKAWLHNRNDEWHRVSSAGSLENLAPLIRDGDAVFFIGNSFMGWGNRPLPQWVAAIGLAQVPAIHIQVDSDILFGNTPLAGFLEHPATKRALASHKYNVYVLQPEEFEPVDHKAAFHQTVREFNRAVTEAGGRSVLFMTWEFRWRQFLDELSKSYDEISLELGIPVIPVGLIYRDCGCAPLQGKSPFFLTAEPQHPEGVFHQNEMGTAVNAFATFEFLTGINPKVTNFAAPGNTNAPASMPYFAEQAWMRVAPSLLSRSKF